MSVPVTHLIPSALMGSGLGKSDVGRGDYDIQMFDLPTIQRHGLGALRFGDLVAITDADHRFGRSFSRGHLAAVLSMAKAALPAMAPALHTSHRPCTGICFAARTPGKCCGSPCHPFCNRWPQEPPPCHARKALASPCWASTAETQSKDRRLCTPITLMRLSIARSSVFAAVLRALKTPALLREERLRNRGVAPLACGEAGARQWGLQISAGTSHPRFNQRGANLYRISFPGGGVAIGMTVSNPIAGRVGEHAKGARGEARIQARIDAVLPAHRNSIRIQAGHLRGAMSIREVHMYEIWLQSRENVFDWSFIRNTRTFE